MGTGEVVTAKDFPLDVLDELGNPTGETVRVRVKETFPSGDSLYEDAEGNVYLSMQSVQRAGGMLVVTDEPPAEDEEQPEDDGTPTNEETGDFKPAA